MLHEIIHSKWERLFHNWEKVAIPPGDLNAAGWNEVGRVPAERKMETLKLIVRSIQILGTCIKEAPEFSARKRHHNTVPMPQGNK